MVVAGLPVTSIERTVADLVDKIGDLSLIGDVLADATRGKRAVDLEHIGLLLTPLAARSGHPRGDGPACWNNSAGAQELTISPQRVSSCSDLPATPP